MGILESIILLIILIVQIQLVLAVFRACKDVAAMRGTLERIDRRIAPQLPEPALPAAEVVVSLKGREKKRFVLVVTGVEGDSTVMVDAVDEAAARALMVSRKVTVKQITQVAKP